LNYRPAVTLIKIWQLCSSFPGAQFQTTNAGTAAMRRPRCIPPAPQGFQQQTRDWTWWSYTSFQP